MGSDKMTDKIYFIIMIFALIGAGVLFFLFCIRKAIELVRRDLKNHQDWLFNQLYTMAPGKVLKPDEIEPKEESKPAMVINPSKDPYAEFKGKKNDWF